jgi:hypothetical protein
VCVGRLLRLLRMDGTCAASRILSLHVIPLRALWSVSLGLVFGVDL